MNHALAVDASVAVKWVLAEPYTEQAQRLWLDCAATRRPVLSAPHFRGEVTNAIYQRVRSSDPVKRLDAGYAGRALDQFLAHPVEQVRLPRLARDAFDFALRHRLPSVYDAIYVVLARRARVELWTADQRLLNALGGTAPWVRFIGDYA